MEKPTQNFESGIAVAVYGGFVLTGVVTTLLGPVLPVLSSQWALTDVQAGRLFTAQFVGSLLGVSFSSLLVPRRGYRMTLGMGYLLMALGIGGLGLGIKDVGLFAVFGYGIGQGFAIPASNLLVSDWNPRRRSAALNLLNFAWSAGAVVCPFYIAMADRSGHIWRWLLGLAVILGVVAVFTRLSPSPPRSAEDRLSSTENQKAWPKAFSFALGLLFFFYVGTETALGGWVATYAKRMDAVDAHMWQFTPSLFWGFLLLGRATAPFFLRWLPEKKLVILDVLVATSGVVILLLAHSVIWVSIASGITGFGLSSVFPITVALLSFFGPQASRAAGPMFALSSLGGAVLPWLVGVASVHLGSLRLALTIPLLALLLILILHGWNAARQEDTTQ